MRGCDVVRRSGAVLLVLCAGALSAWGVDERRPPPQHPSRRFNSRLKLRVYALVQRGKHAITVRVGQMPADEPLTIPACHQWWVEPIGPTDLATVEALAKEITAQDIPGLELPDAGDDHLARLRDLKGLQFLVVPGPGVTDGGLEHLWQLKGLQWLDLARTKVTDAGLAHLRELKGLRSLDLGFTQVTDAGLAHLRALKGLRELSLSETQVTDAGLAHLRELKGLR